jgi:Tol biopolymer transport system component
VTATATASVTQPLGPPALFTQRLGPFSRDFSLNEFLEDGRTIVERTADGTRWTIDNGGRRVSFSPDGKRIAWSVEEEVGNFDVRRDDIWVANPDGSDARRVATLYGGGIQAWFNDSARLLVIGKANRGDKTPSMSILSLADGSLTHLIDVERSRGLLLSPDDRRIVYYVAQATDPAQDGMYLLDLGTSPATPQRLNFFGAYRWCSPTRLYYIPLQTNAPANELWVLDTTNGQSRAVINASADSPFKIGNGDWDVSPDGKRIVYVNARDRNIWMVTLPEAC